MKTKTFFTISLISLFLGLLFFCVKNELLITNFSFTTPQLLVNKDHATKKQVRFFFWHNNQWKAENYDLLWKNNKRQDLCTLINAWLLFLHEENIMQKSVTLQTVLLAATDQVAYVSFDCNPFTREFSTFDKWMWLEGLLKTIRKNKIMVQKIQFLVHHNLLKDPHLDFSKPWLVNGFLESF